MTLKPLLSLLLACVPCLAGTTRVWTQGEYADFQKGNIKGLSLRSDGRLTLAPVSKELFDSSTAYLWALARDSHGVLYAGGGPGARLFRIPPTGAGVKLADFDALEVHAIAIDRQDRVYAATSPDGKVYRLSRPGDPSAKPEVFYDPKQKYIWAMAFAPSGDLYIATGDSGEIHRVTPDGKGSIFFKSDETHVRSLKIDPKGNLIVGTEPGGLVMRIDTSNPGNTSGNEGFVLYQMPKRETTAVAVAPDGSIYAAGVGSKQASAAPVAPVSVPAPTAPPALSAAGTSITLRATAEPPTSLITAAPRPNVTGGSEVWRIYPDGHPERVFSTAQDIVYAITFDRDGRPVLASGNKGTLYRIDSPTRYTSLLGLSISQITALETTRDGAILAATGNVGKVFQFGPQTEKTGSIESDIFDATAYSYWGRLEANGDRNGGTIALQARSGNLDRPQKNWSRWTSAISAENGGANTAPPARFLQWKASVTAGSSNTSPSLDSVDAAYLPKNLAPRVNEIEATPANYKYAAPVVTLNVSALPTTISLPAIGHKSLSYTPPDNDAGASSMSFAKGWIGARWTASDDNGDDLEYKIEIRGVKETQWKLLKDKLRERHYSFDSSVFADGEYRLRITASDALSNTPEEALTGSMESEVLLIDNTPPTISGLTAVRSNTGVRLRWKATDALNNLKKAEYSVNGGDWTNVDPVGRLSDSKSLDYDVVVAAPAGREQTLAVRVTDDYENQSVAKEILK